VLGLSHFLEFVDVIAENVNIYKGRYAGNNRDYRVKILEKCGKQK
jgi:hypothetical protein